MSKVNARKKRHLRVRKHLAGTKERPRLAVFRSAKHIYAQLIDDTIGRTLTAASDVELTIKGNKNSKAFEVGKALAEKAVSGGIKEVVFDRGGFLYHGRVESLAKGAREGGLKF